MVKEWQSYEKVARYLLSRFAETFDLGDVEGKQIVPGLSGTDWEIDAKGVVEGGAGFVVVECKRYTRSKIDQETMGGLAFRIEDTGAEGGIFVTPIGYQEGAEKVAAHRDIKTALLSAESTTTDYVLRFLNHVFIGLSETVTISDQFSVTIRDKDGNVVENRSSGDDG